MRHNRNTNLTTNCASNSKLNRNDGSIIAKILNTLLDIAVSFAHAVALKCCFATFSTTFPFIIMIMIVLSSGQGSARAGRREGERANAARSIRSSSFPADVTRRYDVITLE